MGFWLMGVPSEKPTEILVELQAKVLEDDVFQLFYLKNETASFTERQSVLTEVKGKTVIQSIRFALPLDSAIKKIRIDIGKNVEQQPMVIENVSLKALKQSFDYNISESFVQNVCITFQNGKYITKKISNNYDPFFVSNFNVTSPLKALVLEQKLISRPTRYVISLIFSLALFISLVLKGFKITQLTPDIYISAFVLIITTPPIVKLFSFDDEAKTEEKRELAQEPELTLTESFPREYEAYYNDNFGLRSNIINWSSKMKIGLFKDSPNPELVQFGKDGFMFFNEFNEIDGGIYASYSNTNLASKSQLDHAYQSHFKLKGDLEKEGIKYVVGFWPNKHTIYRNNLPFTMKAQVASDSSLADQAVAYFSKMNMPFFDVRNDLIHNREEKQLYLKFDSHWNSHGAYEAYTSFCRQTFSELGLSAIPREDFDIEYTKIDKGDLTDLLGIEGISSYYDNRPDYKLKDESKNYRFVYPGGIYKNTFVTENKNCGNNKVALVFRDSYGAALIQFLSLHYSKVIYVAKSPVDMYWVDKTKPDVVILGVVERRLPYILETVE